MTHGWLVVQKSEKQANQIKHYVVMLQQEYNFDPSRAMHMGRYTE